MSQYPNVPPYNPGPPYNQAPPPPGFGMPQQTVHTTTIITSAEFGDTPKRMVCPNCRKEIITAVSHDTSLAQHVTCLVMFITGFCTLCSCLPYCVDSLGNVRHECPHCRTHVGSYNRCK